MIFVAVAHADAGMGVQRELTEFAKDNNGHILTMNFSEATTYCAADGFRLPTNEELIRAAEFSEGLGIRETAFKDVGQYDPRVVQERQQNDAEGFTPVLSKTNGITVIACYYDRRHFLRLQGDRGEFETSVIFTSSKLYPNEESGKLLAEVFYRPNKRFGPMGLE